MPDKRAELPLFVSGHGRCGSSLVMQMLRAGGFPITGAAPVYEDPRGALDGFDWVWANQPGRAIKVLSIEAVAMPPWARFNTIFMSRAKTAQAASMFKLLQEMDGTPEIENRQARRAFMRGIEGGLRRDTVAACKVMDAHGDKLMMGFEAILKDPKGSAKKLANWIDPTRDWDIAGMAGVVYPRTYHCQPGFEIEEMVRVRDG